MVVKNSLASDFMIKAILGLPRVAWSVDFLSERSQPAAKKSTEARLIESVVMCGKRRDFMKAMGDYTSAKTLMVFLAGRCGKPVQPFEPFRLEASVGLGASRGTLPVVRSCSISLRTGAEVWAPRRV